MNKYVKSIHLFAYFLFSRQIEMQCVNLITINQFKNRNINISTENDGDKQEKMN